MSLGNGGGSNGYPASLIDKAEVWLVERAQGCKESHIQFPLVCRASRENPESPKARAHVTQDPAYEQKGLRLNSKHLLFLTMGSPPP